MNRPSSYAPILMAAGVTLTLWGAATMWIISAGGLIVVGIGVFRWIRELVSPMPEEND
jgi:hypothetical protein